ncbi:diacylglycerol/lipid kinase family protein [Microbacterium invictum]|uniref:Diacylglycerol kinase family protein n=1 Tax=Microbacterium invictum TaxID=515415 RepID=A0ABZ0VBI4_9MICO|nr:diacylglycerol kinase family protein [Microbacterium invictum]WQB70036.1 diacylglycerol kinase family protein [Microbacterium invictum]
MTTDGSGLLILRNSRSGTAVIRTDPAELFAARLPGARVHELSEGEDLADVVDAAFSEGDPPRVLGVYGGDGSVSRMAGLARRHGVPLLAMPGGTFNHFARSAGLEDVETAVAAYLAGETIEVSAMEVREGDGAAVFALNAASVGAYPELIEERDRRRRRLGKWLGGIVAAWRTMRTAEPLVILRDGRRARVWSVFVGVGTNDPKRVATMQRENLEDPVLDIRIHHARGTRLRAITSLAFGKRTAAVLRAVRLMPEKRDVERLLETDFTMTVRPGPGRPEVWVHDGELEEPRGEEFTLRFTVIPGALTVFAPPPH